MRNLKKSLDKNYKEMPYVNIGTEKSCLFCHLSEHLLNTLQRYPLLHYGVEEALQCAKGEYFVAGIFVFSQLLNTFNFKTPKARHEMAHNILKIRPSRKMHDKILNQFKQAAKSKYLCELSKQKNTTKYHQELYDFWEKLYKQS